MQKVNSKRAVKFQLKQNVRGLEEVTRSALANVLYVRLHMPKSNVFILITNFLRFLGMTN